MKDYTEYKKLRAQGMKPQSAKNMVEAKETTPKHDVTNLEYDELVIIQNGFKFICTAHEDEDAYLLRDFGRFSDEYDDGAISHAPDSHNDYDWFIPENVDTVKGLIELGMDKHSADCRVREEGLENYKMVTSYGDDWRYYQICTEVYLDDEMLGHILLAKNWVGSIDLHDSSAVDRSWVSGIVEEQVSDLLPEAFKKTAELARAFGDLKIHLKDKPEAVEDIDEPEVVELEFYDDVDEPALEEIEMIDIEEVDLDSQEKGSEIGDIPINGDILEPDPVDLDDLADALEEFGATFIYIGSWRDLDGESIRKWVEGTWSEEKEYKDDPMWKRLGEVYNLADALAEYYKAKGKKPLEDK